MNYQSKQMVINALLKVINAAPTLYANNNLFYNAYPPVYSNSDISKQEFDAWVKYANQILDISYDNIGIDDILSMKLKISQISLQSGISNIQRIDQIKRELINLTQIIFQYQ